MPIERKAFNIVQHFKFQLIMDIFLEQNCPNLIEHIKESEYPFEDIVREPLYCVLGFYTPKLVEIFAEQYCKEIDAAIEFADEYDVDISKFDLSTPEKKVGFALMYLTTQLESDYTD